MLCREGTAHVSPQPRVMQTHGTRVGDVLPSPGTPRAPCPGTHGPDRLPPQRITQRRAQLPNKVTGALNYPLTFQWGKLPVKTR